MAQLSIPTAPFEPPSSPKEKEKRPRIKVQAALADLPVTEWASLLGDLARPTRTSTAGGNPVGGSNAGAVGRLREMQERIDAMEAEVEAHDVIEDPKKNSLEERFRKLERGETGDGLEDELAALKARLKK